MKSGGDAPTLVLNRSAPLRCGPEGAALMVLSYDQDATLSYGGSTAAAIAEMEKE